MSTTLVRCMLIWMIRTKRTRFQRLFSQIGFRLDKKYREHSFAQIWIFSTPPYIINFSFFVVLRVMKAKCLKLRCTVWKTNLLTIVNLFTMPNLIALWQSWNSGRGGECKLEFQMGGVEKTPKISHFKKINIVQLIFEIRCQSFPQKRGHFGFF